VTRRYRRTRGLAGPHTSARSTSALSAPVELSRGNSLRGIVTDAARQTPESWREVWADELQAAQFELERLRVAGLTEHELHCEQRHPAYEYATTENARKSGAPPRPQGDGWEPNDIVVWHQYKDDDMMGECWRNWTRGAYTETNYWRRRKPAKEQT
jgi:hypothetical protein